MTCPRCGEAYCPAIPPAKTEYFWISPHNSATGFERWTGRICQKCFMAEVRTAIQREGACPYCGLEVLAVNLRAHEERCSFAPKSFGVSVTVREMEAS